nr:hypothetical protein [Gloeothece citriformis]
MTSTAYPIFFKLNFHPFHRLIQSVCEKSGEYIKLEPSVDGVICSQVFPGLWLDLAALLTGDMAKVLATLQLGLATSEHQNFGQNLSG